MKNKLPYGHLGKITLSTITSSVTSLSLLVWKSFRKIVWLGERVSYRESLLFKNDELPAGKGIFSTL